MVAYRACLEDQPGRFVLQGHGHEAGSMDGCLDATFNESIAKCYSISVSQVKEEGNPKQINLTSYKTLTFLLSLYFCIMSLFINQINTKEVEVVLKVTSRENPKLEEPRTNRMIRA